MVLKFGLAWHPSCYSVVLTNPIVLTATGQTVTTLPNGGGTPAVLLDAIGENRLPSFQNLDLHFERAIRSGRCTWCLRWTCST